MLVSGYSGIGKSSVVNELHKVLVPPRGLVRGRQVRPVQARHPVRDAGAGLPDPGPPDPRSRARRSWTGGGTRLSEALGPNGQLIVNLVPELEFVIGKQPPVPDLPPQDAQNRFQLVFRRFLGVFARQEHPLALFLDDLQWLDAATLDLLEHLVTHPDVRHLLLIGAYRDNEVSSVSPADANARRRSAKPDARTQEIVLAPLGLDDIGRLVADALHCEPERARPLAQLVHEKTGGNPFFAIQFLTALAEEGLLAFDRVAPAWRWDLDRIRAKGYTDNVVDLMAGKLKRLSGSDAGRSAAARLSRQRRRDRDPDRGPRAIRRGDARGALGGRRAGSSSAGGTLQFLHDRIQEAAYALIPESERAEVHLAHWPGAAGEPDDGRLAEHLFDVANQLNRGAALLIDHDEKVRVAAINLGAGRKAKASAAYASALRLFRRRHGAAGRTAIGAASTS